VVGIGGGGDVVGALAVALLARSLGLEARVGGVSWERRPIDPLPGPRTLDEAEGLVVRLHPAAALAGPDTSGPGGFRFAEAHMAAVLGEPVVLVDPTPGPRVVAEALAAACDAVEADLLVLLDVGGDVLGHGHEPGLASPLCDAVLLAAATHLPTRVRAIGALFGPGCDGELTVPEVLERIAEVTAAGGSRGTWGMDPATADVLEQAIETVPTEASAQAVRCARGAIGPSPMRQGRRSVELSPVGALTWFFDCDVAIRTAARCAAAVLDTGSLDEGRDRLAALGIRTELDYERDAAA
jgi:hypothetical protein